MNINFAVIGLIRLGIKSELTPPEADVLNTPPSELLNNEGTTSKFYGNRFF